MFILHVTIYLHEPTSISIAICWCVCSVVFYIGYVELNGVMLGNAVYPRRGWRDGLQCHSEHECSTESSRMSLI